MKAYIVDNTYRVEEVDGSERAYVYLFGRLENGKSFVSKNYFRPYFWIKKKDLAKAKKIVKFDFEELGWKDFSGNEVVKVILDNPKNVPSVRDLLIKSDIISYESDIRFTYRFMMDNNILGTCSIIGKWVDASDDWNVDLYFEEPKFEKALWNPVLKILSLDIETDPRGREIYSVSFHMKEGKKEVKEVFLVHEKKWKNSISFATEKEMLEAFLEKVVELDPDVLVGWNFIDFDVNIIKKRFDHYKLDFAISRHKKWKSRLRIMNDFFRESSAAVPGRQVLDGIYLMKANFVKLEDYRLNTAAKEILGKTKLIEEKKRFDIIDKLYKEDTQKFIDYNLLDSILVTEILEESGVMELSVQRSIITGLPIERLRASVASLDSLYLRELAKIKTVANNSTFGDHDEPTKGGFVMKSKAGIYDFILVQDFKSLYSSIIRTFNIDPMTFIGMNKKGKYVVAENGATFVLKDGILPALIQRLWKERDAAKKKNNKLASFAIKTVMNSFWGVLANPTCRFYSPELANAITGMGRHLIQLSAEKTKELGFDVIYGDTDSIFIDSKAKSFSEAEKVGKKIQKSVNSFYDKHIKEKYYRENYMELEFEKIYVNFLMPHSRGGVSGAKKRYAGTLKDGDSLKVDFVGMEFVRSDWTELAKNFQIKLFDIIFRKENPTKFIRDYVKDLKSGKMDDLLIYKKNIRKNLDEYTKTTPPHVKAARILVSAGKKLDSSIVRYYQTTNGPEPIEVLKSKIDYEHYIEKQLKPIADTILEFYDTNFEDLLRNSKQTSLFGY